MTSTRISSLIHADRPWLSDGGFETTMLFHEGFDLPAFAACVLLDTPHGRDAVADYFKRYIAIAKTSETGFVLDTATWRSGAHWARDVGRSEADMDRLTRESVRLAVALRDAEETESCPIVVNGAVGPAGDGYSPDTLLTPEVAEALHTGQIQAMVDEGAELVSAITMTHVGEAIGIVRAAQKAGVPVVISFTVETDGHLPSGQPLAEAIAEVDAATDAAPIYYMVNCAHPDHFSARLSGDWIARIGGVRANASRMSHAELDSAETLDDGNPEEFGELYGQFDLPNLRVIGGCCGSDDRHVGCAARHVLPHAHAA